MSKTIKETLIKISQNGSIEIETAYDDGTKQLKNVDFDDLANCIRSSVEKKTDIDITSSPTLPGNDKFGVKTVGYRHYSDGRQQIVLFKKAHRCDVTYHTQKFNDVGIPNLLFAVTLKDNKVRSCYVVATMDDVIKDDTKIYHYPYSNASQHNGHICFGGNQVFEYEFEHINNIVGLPSMFLEMPNNDHMYGNNTSKLPYRKLLEVLEGKDFENKYLEDTRNTYQYWFENLIVGGY